MRDVVNGCSTAEVSGFGAGPSYWIGYRREVTKLTLIDSSYIDWCSECGAALMPENRMIHSEWHRDQRSIENDLREVIRRLDAEKDRREVARRAQETEV